MTSIISGNALGLFNSSLDLLGAGSGSSQLGRYGDRLFVNSATGNLVVQNQDELLVGLGLDAALIRTYNSQGLLNDDNGDNWRFNVASLFNIPASPNTAGSVVTKRFGDGAEISYSYDATRNLYISTAGDGAHDTLSFSGGTWTWTNGSSRITETYNGAGQLTVARDVDGNPTFYSYNGTRLTQIDDALGQQHVFIDYDTVNPNNVSQIRTVSGTDTRTAVHYAYDSNNRLSVVTVDLSPENNSILDGNTYTTTYTYEGTSRRIASITQKDGTSISFTYELAAGQYRVKTHSDGEGNVTVFNYGQATQATTPTSANANNGVLSTTETQTTQASYSVNSAALTTTDTQTSNVAVAPYYVVQAGNTWTSIAQTVYGTSHAYIVNALQTALGNVALVAGTRLTMPQTLNVVSTPMAPTANAGALSTSAPLNGGLLTTPTVSWRPASLLEALNTAAATSAQTTFDQNCNGVAIWVLGTDLYVSTYTKNNDMWSAATVLDGSLTGTPATPHLSMSANGSALVTWVQNNNIYARRYVSGAWDGTITIPLLESGSNVAVNPQGAINDSGRAVVVFAQTDGTRYNFFANVYNGTTWQTNASNVDDLGGTNNNTIATTMIPGVAIDPQHNATVVWLQRAGSDSVDSAYMSRYNPSTGTWSNASATTFESTTTAVTSVKITLDQNGNGLAVWLQGGIINAKSYTRTSNNWSAVTTWGTSASAPHLSMSANGNALVTWVQGNNINARRYANSVWVATTEVVENLAGVAASPIGSINNGGQAAIVFVQNDGTRNNVYANRFTAGAWQASATSVDDVGTANNNTVATTMMSSVAIDAQGNVNTVWLQKSASETNDSVFSSRFNTNTAPYYVVPAGATWSSIANTLYGTTSVASQLQTALGDPALTAGGKLSGFPASFTVAAYYTVQAGNSWASITQTVYGATDANAVSALQSALGNPTLSTGLRLTVPQTLNYNTTAMSANANNGVLSATETQTATIVVAPYYRVQTGDTWASIAAALYGTSSVASQLQTALGNPALTSGAHLTGLPASLAVTTVTNTTVAPYYIVQVGNTWSSITQAVYGTAVANAVNALRIALGNPTLSTGMHLTVPQTLSYMTGAVAVNQLSVVDPLNQTTVYNSDLSGRLLGVTSASGILTAYSYDTSDNVVGIADGNGNSVVMQYDSNGNVLLRRDAAGNSVVRRYDQYNQLVNETMYLVADPDGAGAALPGGPLTTRYVYDGESHVRFVVSSQGRVTEYRYNSNGTRAATLVYAGAFYDVSGLTEITELSESQLTVWSAAQDLTKLERTDYSYDFRGQLSTITTYVQTNAAGVGTGTPSVTHYVYDQRGQLLQTIDARNNVTPDPLNSGLANATTYLYDGLGRITRKVQWIAAGSTSTTLYTYDDINRKSSVELANHLVSTSTYDRRGLLTSFVQSDVPHGVLGTTTYQYDADGNLRIATDPSGAKTYSLYDNDDRSIATIDATGAMRATIYDNAGNVVKTISYANRLSPAALASLVNIANPAVTADSVRPSPSADDRVAYSFYDTANRRTVSLEPTDTNPAQAYVTRYVYDGADRVMQEIRHASPISVPAAPILTNVIALIAADATNDRSTRYFYDADGKVLARLDAEGFLTENKYNAAGHLVETVAYAVSATTDLWAADFLAQLKTSVGTNTKDRHTYAFFDGSGRQIGMLDAENYLTEYAYDVVGNRTQDVRYFINAIPYTGTQTVAQLRPHDIGAKVTLTEYDGANRVVLVTSNPLGTVTRYSYDAVGQLERTDSAVNTNDVRTTVAQYDSQGRVVKELSPEGATALDLLMGKRSAAADAADLVPAQNIPANFNLNSGALTQGNGVWVGPALVSASAVGSSPVIASDANGNAIAVWRGGTGAQLFGSRYDKATNTWGAPVSIYVGTTMIFSAPKLAVDGNGNAVVVWSQGDQGINSVWSARYNATTQTWSGAELLETSSNTAGSFSVDGVGMALAMKNGKAVAVWQQMENGSWNVYARYLNGGVWGATQLLQVASDQGMPGAVDVDIDTQGNAIVAWTVNSTSPDVSAMYVSTYSATSGTWATNTLIDTGPRYVTTPSYLKLEIKVGLDANGNGFAVWQRGADIFTRRYTASSGTWSAPTTLDINANEVFAPRLAVDAQGNALVAWVQSDGSARSMYGRYFNATSQTWGATQLLESTSIAVSTPNLTDPLYYVSLNNGSGAVMWNVADGTGNYFYATRISAGVWQTSELLAVGAGVMSVTATPTGEMAAVWWQSTGTAGVYASRFIPGPVAYYDVRRGSTWASVAQELYGSPSVAGALQSALGNSPLLTGMRLANLPTTLAGTTLVAAYYQVVSGDTWASITQNIYGTSDPNAIAALQTALGNPALSVGAHLNVPALLNYAVPATPSDPQINAVWTQYGLVHTYDGMARRTSTTDQNGNKTLFFYDEAGRQRFVVNAQGEVTQNTYNAFGEISDTYQYVNRISTTGLLGGAIVQTLLDRVAAGAQTNGTDAAGTNADLHAHFNYTLRGAIRQTIDAPDGTPVGDNTVQYAYSAFGELKNKIESISSGVTTTTAYQYDRRGSLTQTIEDQGGLNRIISSVYDAFGRVTQTTDANGSIRSSSYDRLGRLITTTDASGTRTNTYDALSRVLTSADALGNKTGYAYDDIGRSFTITTPEGLSTVTRVNRHGETVELEMKSVAGQSVKLTRYEYDRNGNLLSETVDPVGGSGTHLGLRTEYTYDRANRRTLVKDANGVYTRFDFDPSNRLLTRTTDPKSIFTENDNPAGLELVSSTTYDGQGRVVTQTDATLTVTRHFYDKRGRLSETVLDPTGLNVRTTYAYDQRGQTIAVTEAAGTVDARTTRYVYDKLGRRIEQYVDAGSTQASAWSGAASLGIPSTATSPSIAFSTSGDGFLVYRDGDHVFLRRYDKASDHWSAVEKIDAFDGPISVAPRLAMDAQGNALIVWAQASSSDPQNVRIYGRRYDTTTQQWIWFGPLDTYSWGPSVSGFEGDLSVAVNGSHAAVTWQQSVGGTKAVYTAIYQGDTGGGPPPEWIAPQLIRADGRKVATDIDTQGNVLVSWTEANGAAVYVRRYDAATGAWGIAVALETATAYADIEVKVEFDAAGNAFALWNRAGQLFVRRYDVGTGNWLVAYAIDANANNVYSPKLTVDALGNALVAWVQSDGTANSVYGNFFNAATRTWSGPQLLETSSVAVAFATSDPALAVALVNGRGAVVWQQSDGSAVSAYAARINNGSWSAAQLLELGAVAVSSPSVAVDASGNILVSWYQSGVFQNRYSIDDGLNLKTVFAYDMNDNVVAKVEGAGTADQRTTRYSYDELNRLIYEVDATGGVTHHDYDAESHVIATIRHEVAISLDGLGNFVTTAQVEELLAGYGTEQATYYAYDKDGRLTFTTDSLLRLTEFEYDGSGRIVRTVRYNEPIGWIYDFSNLAQLRAARDAIINPMRDRTTRTVYDAAGRAVFSINALNYVTETKYDGNGNVVRSITYAGVITIPAVVDEAGIRSAVNVSLADRTTRIVYDRANRPRYSIDALGFVKETVYDGVGNVKQVLEYPKSVNVGTLPTLAEVSAALAALPANDPHRTYFDYDRANRIVAKTFAQGTSDQYTETFAYDAFGNLIRHTNGRGSNEYSAYDGADRLVRHIDYNGYVVDYRYDSLGNLRSETAYINAVASPAVADDRWAYPYHASNPVVNTDLNVGDRTTIYTYDKLSRVVSRIIPQVVNPSGGAVDYYVYDSFGNLSAETDAAYSFANLYKTYLHDSVGRLLLETAEASYSQSISDFRESSFDYDSFDNQTHIIDPRGFELGRENSEWAIAERLRLGYSINDNGTLRGKLVAELTEEEREALTARYQTMQEFDRLDRKTAAVDPFGNRTETVYNAFGDIVKAIDPNGNTGYFYYDNNGKLTLQVDPAGYVTQTIYDAYGNAKETIKYAGKVQGTWSETTRPEILAVAPTGTPPAAYLVMDAAHDQHTLAQYDALNRTKQITDAENHTESFTYDAQGNVKTHLDKNAALFSYDYDAIGHKTVEYLPVTSANGIGQQIQVVNRYEYDLAGNKTKCTEAYGLPEERVTQYVYNKNDRLIETIEPGIKVATETPLSGIQMQIVYSDATHYGPYSIQGLPADGVSGKLVARPVSGSGDTVEFSLRPNGPTSLLVVANSNTPSTYAFSGDYIYEAEIYGAQGQLLYKVSHTYTPTIYSMNYNVQSATAVTYSVQTPRVQKFYDGRGNLVQETDAKGNISYFYYDAAQHRIATVDAERYLHRNFYDDAGNLVAERVYDQTIPLSLTLYPSQFPNPASIAGMDATKYRETTHRYDVNNRLIESSTRQVLVYDRDNGLRTQTLTMTQQYDRNGNITLSTDANGGRIYSFYDKVGNKTLQVDALNFVTAWDYDANGNAVQQTRYATALTSVVSVTSDPVSLRTQAGSSADNRATVYGYDRLNRVTSETVLSLAYASLGALHGELSLLTGNAVTQYEYDAESHRTAVVAADGGRTDYLYDALGRNTLEQGPGFTDFQGAAVRRVTQISYDGVGNAKTVTRKGKTVAEDQVTSFEYDAHGNLLKQTDALGYYKVYTYDLNANVISAVGQRSNLLSSDDSHWTYEYYGYDKLNRRVTTRDDNNLTRASTYDAHGEIVSNGVNGVAREYFEYDLAGRLVKTNQGDGVDRAYLSDAEGNTTAKIESGIANTDLRPLTLDQIVNLDPTLVRRGAGLPANTPVILNTTQSEYDARNELVATYALPVTFGNGSPNQTVWVDAISNPFLGGTVTVASGGAVGYQLTQTSYPYPTGIPFFHCTATLAVSWPQITGYGEGAIKVEWITPYQTKIFAVGPGSTSATTTLEGVSATPQGFPTQTVRVYKETPQGDILISTWNAGSVPTGSASVPLASSLCITGQQPNAQSLQLWLWPAGGTQPVSPILVPILRTMDGTPIPGQFRLDTTGYAGNYQYEFKTLDANNNELDNVKGTLTLGTGGSVTTKLVKTVQATPSILVASQTFNAFGEVTSETDRRGHALLVSDEAWAQTLRHDQLGYAALAAGLSAADKSAILDRFTIKLRYDVLGMLIEKKDHLTQETKEDGSIASVRPTTEYFYDKIGNTVGMRDANHNANTQRYDTAGNLLAVYQGLHYDAVGNFLGVDVGDKIKTHGYDVFGNKRYDINELGERTDSTYDKRNLLTRIDRQTSASFLTEAGVANAARYETYEYDEQGRRITHTNARGLVERTYYDGGGRVLRTQGMATVNYSYRYDAASGGMTVAQDSTRFSDTEDYFGRKLLHTDYGNRTYRYLYDKAGRLTYQIGNTDPSASFVFSPVNLSGSQFDPSTYASDDAFKAAHPEIEQFIHLYYYDNGYLKGQFDYGVNTRTQYTYDAEGNRISEWYYQETVSGPSYYQASTARYDELDRVVRIDDSKYSVMYEYDANGNRRHIYAEYHDGLTAGINVQDYWYTYDSLNRFLISKGTYSGTVTNGNNTHTWTRGSGNISYGQNGTIVSYDLAGRRSTSTYVDGASTVNERYDYTVDGYLINTYLNNVQRSNRVYDAVGNVRTFIERNASGSVIRSYTNTYSLSNLLSTENDGTFTKTYGYTYGNSNTAAVASITAPQAGGTTLTTTYAYQNWDSLKQIEIKNQASNQSSPNWAPGFSHFTYDANGHLTQVKDEAGNRTLSYKLDMEGRILMRNELSGTQTTRTQYYYYFNGIAIGDSGSFGVSRRDYATVLAEHEQQAHWDDISRRAADEDERDRSGHNFADQFTVNPDGTTKVAPHASKRERRLLEEHNNDEKARRYAPVVSADFDNNFQDINDTGNSPGNYTVRSAGETLQTIALSVWGDSSLWYLIADANGLPGSPTLTAGQNLVIPNVGTNIHNNASTIKVYNPGQLIGDTTPTLPEPPPPPTPKDNSCGFIGQIIVMIVVIVVAYYTGIYLEGLELSPAVVAAGSAAAGSIAGQLTGMAIGIQDKFSWNAVALAAITAGVSKYAGINTATVQGAVANNVLSQGVGILLGMQDRFSWSSLATAAITAPMDSAIDAEFGSGAVSSKSPGTQFTMAGFGKALAGEFLKSTIHQTVSAITNRNGVVSWEAVAVDALGNAIGNAITGNAQYNRHQLLQNQRPLVPVVNPPLLRPRYSSEVVYGANGTPGIRASSADVTAYYDALDYISNLPLKPIFDRDDPHQYLMFIANDGTQNDREKMKIDTNPGELERLVNKAAGAENVQSFYLRGVGTDWDPLGLDSALGLTQFTQAQNTYDSIVRTTNNIYAGDSEASFVFADVGFSRGATSIRMLQNMLVDKGIPDTSSGYETYEGNNLVIKYERYIVAPSEVNIGASVLFDTVSTGLGSFYNLSVPRDNVSNTLHLTARDEDRVLFPLVSAIDRSNPSDPGVLEFRSAGAHTDIGGGSYDENGIGRMNMKLAYTYLDKLGVPMAPFPAAFEPDPANFVIHDSRWIKNEPFDQLLNRGIDREVNYVQRR